MCYVIPLFFGRRKKDLVCKEHTPVVEDEAATEEDHGLLVTTMKEGANAGYSSLCNLTRLVNLQIFKLSLMSISNL